jgi:CubicO group peptidase (beta-lactamase class C family)
MMILPSDRFTPNCIPSWTTRQHNLRIAHVVFFCVVSLLTLWPICCQGQDRRSPLVEERIERVLREQANMSGAAGFAFGIIQDDSTILECYTGYASWEGGTRVDSSSVFNWASLSKGLTAVCALKMAEQGQLNLDADVKEYIPELGLDAHVTLRQLLDQQGGIGGYEAYPELMQLKKLDRNSLTQQAILEKMMGKQTVFKPGSYQGYSSPGYILLSIAMERAAKKSFAEIVDEIVAKPLKLSSLRVGGVADVDVVPYRLVNGKREPIEDTNNDWRLGAGAIKSNLPDALTFASSLIRSSVLTPASSKELFKRRATVRLGKDKGDVFKKSEASQVEAIGVNYGGFMRIGEGSDGPIAASGMQPGARSLLIIYPRQQMASVIFANTTPLDLEKIQLAAMEAATEK